MNAKNILQEYCQKNGFNLPSYQTSKTLDGLFISEVTVHHKKYNGKAFSKKRDAEVDAADKANQKINKENFDKKIIYQNGEKWGIFIDLENKQKIYEELEQYYHLNKSQIDIYIFITKNHILSQKEYQYATIYTIDSMMRDAVDSYLIFILGRFFNRYQNFIIVSGDHYAKTMEEILVKEGKKAKMCANIREIMEIIKE